MSVTSSRPRVRRITNPAVVATAASGAVLLSALAREALASLRREPDAISTMPAIERRSIASPAAVQRSLAPVMSGAPLGLPADRAVVSALRVMAASSCFVQPCLQHAIDALVEAGSAEGVHAAATAIAETAIVQHGPIAVRALTSACANAMRAVGLDRIDVRNGGAERVEVTGISTSGPSLVSEIELDVNGDLAIRSEVLDGGGRCDALIAAFDAALEAEGVVSDAPSRRATGGICQLRAAEAFVRGRLTPAVAGCGAPAAVGSSAATRRRRLAEPAKGRTR